MLLVADPWDVAKCWEAEICNVVAPLTLPQGAGFSPEQIKRLQLIKDHLKPEKFLLWYHRDAAGEESQTDARHRLQHCGFCEKGFDWDQSFPNSRCGKRIVIPDEISSPCDMSTEQLRWLRKQGIA